MANGINGYENLKDYNHLTEDEQKALVRKGGKASGEARRKKRDMRLQAEALLQMKVTDNQKTLKAAMKALGIKEGDQTYSMGILTAMMQQAASGNVKAAQFLRDTAGFMPEQKLEIDADAKIENDVMIYLPDNGRGDANAGVESDEG